MQGLTDAMFHCRGACWWLRFVIGLGVGAVALFLTGCASKPLPVDRPCGVIEDSLHGVNATDRAGQMRLDIHHNRGRNAGCWQ